MSFEGKAGFVAGAGGGMGLNIANDLIEAGANVALADVKPKPDEIRDGPGRHIYCEINLTAADAVKAAIGETVAAFGRLDYLVNTTGVLWLERDVSLVYMEPEVWDRVLEINLKSHMLTARAAIPEMTKSGGGAMVHFASIDALSGDPKPQDAYGASKAAVIRLSKAIAIQFAKDGIRSNAILPGPVLSPMQERWQGKPELQAEIGGHIPLGRLGTTQDQANACLFLLSDKAAWITGTELIVDGGVTALP